MRAKDRCDNLKITRRLRLGVHAVIEKIVGVVAQSVPIPTSKTLSDDYTVDAAENGGIYYLDEATGCDVTLPLPRPNLQFEFVVKTAPTSNGYVIGTAGGADILIGGINELEVDTEDDGPYDDDADSLTFAANTAVVGDWVRLRSDGTSWYFTGQTQADGGVVPATA